jgi:hypothetical protein
MTPRDQEFLAVAGQPGDCARAVIASLLDLPMAEVPHFLADSDRTAFGFYSLIEDFLEERGLSMDWQSSPIYYLKSGQDVYHWISGPSPRGNDMSHAVVGLNGAIVHDPHPSRAGLLGEPENWKHSFLIKANP